MVETSRLGDDENPNSDFVMPPPATSGPCGPLVAEASADLVTCQTRWIQEETDK